MMSIWEKETFFAPQDVIIAGSGFVGLWSALYLKKKHPSLKITILDRGIIPTGASTRNAGFACFGSLSELIEDAKKMGPDKMCALVEMRYRGLERIQKYFGRKKIDFDLCGGYELYDSRISTSEADLAGNIDYLNTLVRPITGKKRTYALADDQVSAFGFGDTLHMVKNDLEGYLHSGKLVQCLLQHIQGEGVQVINGIEIKSFNHFNEQIEVETNRHLFFTCKKLLVCTNAFARELLPDEDIVPARGQVLVTSPISGLLFKGTFHSDEGFYYFRNLGNRVLLGGARNKAFEDEQTTDMNTTDFIQGALERYLDEVVLPRHTGKYTIDHRWSGIMAMGSEKMPIVKEVMPNVYCAVRMSGMGVALAPIVGQRVSAMMT